MSKLKKIPTSWFVLHKFCILDQPDIGSASSMAKQGKSKIIDTAFYLFLQNGYNGTSIQDIMSAVDLSKGAIYYYFQSKHAIYLAVVEKFYIKQVKRVGRKDSNLHFVERMRNRYEIFCEIFENVEKSGPRSVEFPIRAYFIFQLESERDNTIQNRIEQIVATEREEVMDIVQLAIDREEVQSDLNAETIAYQLIALIEGIAIHHSSVRANCAALLRSKYQSIVDPYLDIITTSSIAANNPK